MEQTERWVYTKEGGKKIKLSQNKIKKVQNERREQNLKMGPPPFR